MDVPQHSAAMTVSESSLTVGNCTQVVQVGRMLQGLGRCARCPPRGTGGWLACASGRGHFLVGPPAACPFDAHMPRQKGSGAPGPPAKRRARSGP